VLCIMTFNKRTENVANRAAAVELVGRQGAELVLRDLDNRTAQSCSAGPVRLLFTIEFPTVAYRAIKYTDSAWGATAQAQA